jgi:hypothetical protein
MSAHKRSAPKPSIHSERPVLSNWGWSKQIMLKDTSKFSWHKHKVNLFVFLLCFGFCVTPASVVVAGVSLLFKAFSQTTKDPFHISKGLSNKDPTHQYSSSILSTN